MDTGSRRFPTLRGWLLTILCVGIVACPVHGQAQEVSVTTHVELINPAAETQQHSSAGDLANVVVWLSAADKTNVSIAPTAPASAPRLIQRNKSFEPHLLVVEVGTVVQFPNKDPFFHNIFSLYEGKPFDLGLYEAGSTRTVRFDRPGVSFLFCNIHSEMSAVVVAVDTPYFAISDSSGQIRVRDVPPGRYVMHVWYERGKPEDLQSLNRLVTISSATRTLPVFQVVLDPNFTWAHKNKYGQDYVPPPTPEYQQP
jgi:plastocyanin